MNYLTLVWTEAGQVKSWQITEQMGTVRLGRDPSRCQVVFSHPTVSGLHVDISFQPQQQRFVLRNLRPSNPPMVNGQVVTQAEVTLTTGDRLLLGDLLLVVQACYVRQPTAVAYGLQCPRCQQICAYDRLDLGCPWCGTSLASAASVIMP